MPRTLEVHGTSVRNSRSIRIKKLFLLILALASSIILAACAGGTPAGGWSSPTVANGIVYFGGTNGKLYALNANTGDKIWAYAGEQGKPLGSIYGSPAVENGVVYFGALDGTLYALDALTGAPKWPQPFDATADAPDKRGIVPSPIVGGGVIYFGANDHNFYAVDAGTGLLKWRFSTGDKIWADATIADQTIYFGSFDHHLYALNLDGSPKWVKPFDAGGMIVSKPLVADGLVYFGALERLFALDAATGADKWPETKLDPDHWIWSNPTTQNKLIYVSDLAEKGQVHAFDALSGSKKWDFDAGGQVHSSVTISDTVGYFGTANNQVFAVDANNGTAVWKQSLEAPIYASPTVAGDVVYVNSHGRSFYALLVATGLPKWCFDTTQDKLLAASACIAVQ